MANLFVLPLLIDHGLIYINMSAVKWIALTILLTLNTPALSIDSLQAKFAKRDRNKDGKLLREEVSSSFAKFKFTQANRNKNGFLDQSEIERVARKLSAKANHNPYNPINPIVPKANNIRIFNDIFYRKDTKGWNQLDLYLPKVKRFSISYGFIVEGYIAAINPKSLKQPNYLPEKAMG